MRKPLPLNVARSNIFRRPDASGYSRRGKGNASGAMVTRGPLAKSLSTTNHSEDRAADIEDYGFEIFRMATGTDLHKSPSVAEKRFKPERG